MQWLCAQACPRESPGMAEMARHVYLLRAGCFLQSLAAPMPPAAGHRVLSTPWRMVPGVPVMAALCMDASLFSLGQTWKPPPCASTASAPRLPHALDLQPIRRRGQKAAAHSPPRSNGHTSPVSHCRILSGIAAPADRRENQNLSLPFLLGRNLEQAEQPMDE